MKYILIFLLVFFASFSHAQTITHQDWKIENVGQWGSFYWGVSRTAYPDNYGKYYYYVFFYSNSYMPTKSRDGVNYDKAITYIADVRIFMDEQINMNGKIMKFNTVEVNSPSISCDWIVNQGHSAWFYSSQPYNRFRITYGGVSAFNYSNY